jgi:opacity protein-like surface antigen
MKNFTLLLILAIFSVSFAGAQTNQNDDEWENFNPDSVDKDNYNFYWGFDKFFDKRNYYEKNRPTMEVNYLYSEPTYSDEKYTGGLASVGGLDVRFGTTNIILLDTNVPVVKTGFNYFFVSNYSESYGSTIETGDVRTDAWRFGLGENKGYAYRIGKKAFIELYHGGGLGWTKFDFKDAAANADDQQALDDFGSQFRFGQQFEGGIKIRTNDYITLNAGYERALVFPRHMFWYWAWSGLIEGVSQGVGGIFINMVEKSTPELVPIVNFIVRNAISYGFYELRIDDMNWPVETVPPYMFNTYRIGLTFNM